MADGFDEEEKVVKAPASPVSVKPAPTIPTVKKTAPAASAQPVKHAIDLQSILGRK